MVIPGSGPTCHAALMDRVFCFRHAIFVEEKG
jgi:acyl-homoserine lactone synthase